MKPDSTIRDIPSRSWRERSGVVTIKLLAGFGNRAMLPSNFSRVVVRGLDAAQVKK